MIYDFSDVMYSQIIWPSYRGRPTRQGPAEVAPLFSPPSAEVLFSGALRVGTIRHFAPSITTHFGSRVQTEVTVTHDCLLISRHCSAVYTWDGHPEPPTGDGQDLWSGCVETQCLPVFCFSVFELDKECKHYLSGSHLSTDRCPWHNQEVMFIIVIKLAHWDP